MIYFFRALSAEQLKLKRSLAMWMVLIAPLAVCFLYLMIMLKTPESYYDPSAWEGEIKSILSMWSVMMLPLYITLETALTANSEHNHQIWKYLYALPIPRWSIFSAKWVMNLFLVLSSSVVCFILTIGAGIVMRYVFPETGFVHNFPWTYALTVHGKVFLASLFIISIHTWISLNWKNIIIAIGSGMVAAVGNLTIMMSEKWGAIFPWTLPFYAYAVEDVNLIQIYAIALGGSLLFAIFGSFWLSKKQIF